MHKFSGSPTQRAARGLLALAAAIMMVRMLTACNTTAGAGRDLENLGDNIEDAAEDAKH